MTQYVVMSTIDPDAPDNWHQVGFEEARDARAAIAAHVKGDGAVGGMYLAIPSRSFKPVTVGTQTTTRLTFS